MSPMAPSGMASIMTQFWSYAADFAVFTLAYSVGSALLHFAIHRLIAWMGESYFARFARRRPAAQEVTKAAFDWVTILQFAAWVPLGFGAWELSPFHLFMIPMAHEIYDIVFAQWMPRSSFTAKQARFVYVHHGLSTVSRVAIALLVLASLPSSLQVDGFRLTLLYYCCSVFLVAPEAFGELLFKRADRKGRLVFRTACFALARLSHLALYVGAMIRFWPELSPWQALAFGLPIGLLVAVNEAHSISSALPKLRADWQKQRAKKGVASLNRLTLPSPARAGRSPRTPSRQPGLRRAAPRRRPESLPSREDSLG
jgi:hypothetical protein